jgi:hypothetical protein
VIPQSMQTQGELAADAAGNTCDNSNALHFHAA